MNKIEIINNSFSKMYKEFSYADNVDIHNTFMMLMNWYFEKNPTAVDVIFNAKRIDRFDFFSTVTFGLIKINNGWNAKGNFYELGNGYMQYGPVIISKTDLALFRLALLMFDYMVEHKTDLGYGIAYSK